MNPTEMAARVVQGAPITAVAREAGVTRQRVSQILHALGIRLDGRQAERIRQIGERNRAEIGERFDAGQAPHDIADALGLSTSTVWSHLRATGRQRPRGWSHGTAYGWTKCRCAECKRAMSDYTARMRSRGIAPDGKHGLNGYTNWGCRCDVCRAAKSVENRRQAERRKGLA